MSKLRLIAGGLKSFLPTARRYTMSAKKVDAAYGYSVWLRHIEALDALGIAGPIGTIVELGPGNSIATGICALVSGAEKYVGLDVLDHIAYEQAEQICQEITELFERRSPIPGEETYRSLLPTPRDHAFPLRALQTVVNPRFPRVETDRLQECVQLLSKCQHEANGPLRYQQTWDASALPPDSVDFVFSQAVLEEIPHVGARSPLRSTFESMYSWLKPGGISSHQIDLSMYGLKPWNIHWTWSDAIWTLIRGRRDNFVNREPLSTYTSLAVDVGFEVVSVSPVQRDGVPLQRLTRRFRELPESERSTAAAFLILRKV